MGEWDYAPSIDTAATPAQVWSVYEDVDSWILWYPGATDVRLAGDLVDGARGKVTTTQGQVLPIRVSSVDREQGFVTETSIADDCTLQVRHTLAEQPGAAAAGSPTRPSSPDGPWICSGWISARPSTKSCATACKR